MRALAADWRDNQGRSRKFNSFTKQYLFFAGWGCPEEGGLIPFLPRHREQPAAARIQTPIYIFRLVSRQVRNFLFNTGTTGYNQAFHRP